MSLVCRKLVGDGDLGEITAENWSGHITRWKAAEGQAKLGTGAGRGIYPFKKANSKRRRKKLGTGCSGKAVLLKDITNM